MAYYREVYQHSPLWDGTPLHGKCIIWYAEQGFGDIIMAARYIPRLDGDVIIHCLPPIYPLLKQFPNVVGFIDKNEEILPDHDCHVPSLSVPDILHCFAAPVPYLTAEPMVLDQIGIGISWEGNTDHPRNLHRSCPLKYFKRLPQPLYMLQPDIYTPEFTRDCEDLELLGVEINDFADLARLVAAMDLVISVDTAVLHLAGALGKKTLGLLDAGHDDRWKGMNWYPSVELWRQPVAGDWQSLFEDVVYTFERRQNGEKIQ